MNPYTLSDPELQRLLDEDAALGDATTLALAISALPAIIEYRARHDMIVCGAEEAARMGALRGLSVRHPPLESGTPVSAGTLLLAMQGTAASAHMVWKSSQTLMEYLSGIASAGAELVDAARRGRMSCRVVCTRKNFPGTKAAAVKAVLCSGASPHRLSLSETLLLFPEHRAFCAGIRPEALVARLRSRWPERNIVVELDDVDEALLWAHAGVDVLQLEKMAPEAVTRCREALDQDPALAARKPLLAAAGGVSVHNAEAYARAGADLLVTSAPFFSRPRDVAVTLCPDTRTGPNSASLIA